jgi:hypothetical protein
MTNEAPGQGQETEGSSEYSRTVGEPTSESGNIRLNLDEVLDCLGRAEGEFTAVCHRPTGGEFTSSVVKPVDASAEVNSLPEKACIWFSVNPTAGPERHNQGRGREREVSRWAALYLDVDVKDGAFPDLDKAAEFVGALSDMIGTRPSVVIHSGHGLQPVWPIEDGDLDTEVKWARAYRLSRRFGRLAARVAGDFSVSLDKISDLTRVLRVPGTTNWKDPEHPAQAYAVRDSGGPLTVDQVEEFLDKWAPEIELDEPVSGEAVSSPDNWSFGQATCPYVAKMVRSWNQESDRPSAGRHQWAMTRCVRLAAAHRLGCISEDDQHGSLRALQVALTHWCQVVGTPRGLYPDEIGSGYRWAVGKVASFTDEQAWRELPGHTPHSCSADQHVGQSEDDVGQSEDEGEPPRPTRRRLSDRLLSLADLRNLPPVEPLIDGLLYRDTLAQLSGPPGCYKSFATIAMSCALAAGVPFGDFAVPKAGKVVYVAAEGASGLESRILAWCDVWGVGPAALQDRLFILPSAIQLGEQRAVSEAVDVVREIQADLLVLDTRARCTLGLEENSATAQGTAIDAADQIRAAAGCTVLGVHHSSRTGSAGRGSNAWDGAVWSDLRMEGGGLEATIHCEKHKDVAAGCDHRFSLVRHIVSAELMPRTLEPERSTLVMSSRSAGLDNLSAKSHRVVLDIIWTLAPPEGFTGPQLVALADEQGVKRASVYTALKWLANEGYIKNIGTEVRSRYVPGDRKP